VNYLIRPLSSREMTLNLVDVGGRLIQGMESKFFTNIVGWCLNIFPEEETSTLEATTYEPRGAGIPPPKSKSMANYEN
jgi:hypothetical protein